MCHCTDELMEVIYNLRPASTYHLQCSKNTARQGIQVHLSAGAFTVEEEQYRPSGRQCRVKGCSSVR